MVYSIPVRNLDEHGLVLLFARDTTGRVVSWLCLAGESVVVVLVDFVILVKWGVLLLFRLGLGHLLSLLSLLPRVLDGSELSIVEEAKLALLAFFLLLVVILLIIILPL